MCPYGSWHFAAVQHSSKINGSSVSAGGSDKGRQFCQATPELFFLLGLSNCRPQEEPARRAVSDAEVGILFLASARSFQRTRTLLSVCRCSDEVVILQAQIQKLPPLPSQRLGLLCPQMCRCALVRRNEAAAISRGPSHSPADRQPFVAV